MNIGIKKIVIFCATGEWGSRIAAGCAKAGHEVIGVSRGQDQRHMVDLNGCRLPWPLFQG